MIEEIHILLTYECNYECSHCFLYCGPQVEGTFTLEQIVSILEDAKKFGTVDTIYFEGGEPFLHYDLMISGLTRARNMGFRTGIVTNGYWATSDEEAVNYLQPLVALEIDDISMSDDLYHGGGQHTPAKTAVRIAEKLGLPVNVINIEGPIAAVDGNTIVPKGATIDGGSVRFRGRAADRLVKGRPRKPPETIVECPYEDLTTPQRVHVDAFGHVHFCQGISIGNIWQTPLTQLLAGHRSEDHPICGPLIAGGPDELARTYGVEPEDGYADACHYCFSVRRLLLDRFPEHLAPRSVYGSSGEALKQS